MRDCTHKIHLLSSYFEISSVFEIIQNRYVAKVAIKKKVLKKLKVGKKVKYQADYGKVTKKVTVKVKK